MNTVIYAGGTVSILFDSLLFSSKNMFTFSWSLPRVGGGSPSRRGPCKTRTSPHPLDYGSPDPTITRWRNSQAPRPAFGGMWLMASSLRPPPPPASRPLPATPQSVTNTYSEFNARPRRLSPLPPFPAVYRRTTPTCPRSCFRTLPWPLAA